MHLFVCHRIYNSHSEIQYCFTTLTIITTMNISYEWGAAWRSTLHPQTFRLIKWCGFALRVMFFLLLCTHSHSLPPLTIILWPHSPSLSGPTHHHPLALLTITLWSHTPSFSGPLTCTFLLFRLAVVLKEGKVFGHVINIIVSLSLLALLRQNPAQFIRIYRLVLENRIKCNSFV